MFSCISCGKESSSLVQNVRTREVICTACIISGHAVIHITERIPGHPVSDIEIHCHSVGFVPVLNLFYPILKIVSDGRRSAKSSGETWDEMNARLDWEDRIKPMSFYDWIEKSMLYGTAYFRITYADQF